MTEYDVPRKVMLVEVPQRGIGWLIYNTVDFVEKKEDENGKDTED